MARQYGGNNYVEAPVAEESKWKKKVRIAIPCVLIAATLGIGVYGSYNVSKYNKLLDEANTKYDETYVDWSNLKQQIEADGESGQVVEEIDAVINSAKEDGKKVCDLQNKLIEYNIKEVNDFDLSEGHKQALTDLRNMLPSSSTTDDTARSSWSYIGTWQFENTYDFTGTTVPVVWTCYANDSNNNKRLVAVTTAKYNATDKLFYDVTVRYTSWYNSINTVQEDKDDVESRKDSTTTESTTATTERGATSEE